ncbi:MAG: hypothetical protein IPF54_08010 [Draconibacterium sp.]|nr:hypothetical protein [Draconibacterium sp.]
MERIAVSATIAVLVAGAGTVLSPVIERVIHTKLNLSILLITILAVLVANLFPKSLKNLKKLHILWDCG